MIRFAFGLVLIPLLALSWETDSFLSPGAAMAADDGTRYYQDEAVSRPDRNSPLNEEVDEVAALDRERIRKSQPKPKDSLEVILMGMVYFAGVAILVFWIKRALRD